MELIILSLLICGLFCVVTCPRLYVIYSTRSEEKYNYQIMES